MWLDIMALYDLAGMAAVATWRRVTYFIGISIILVGAASEVLY
jgi:hypothetical protein